jgi:hypothetical protein
MGVELDIRHVTSRALRVPRAVLAVEVDDGVLAGLEHEVEVAAVDGLVGPPTVDDPPLLADERDVLPVDAARRAVSVALDERRPRTI